MSRPRTAFRLLAALAVLHFFVLLGCSAEEDPQDTTDDDETAAADTDAPDTDAPDTPTSACTASVGEACSVGTGVCAASGVTVCDEASATVRCDATAGAPQPGACDGLDNDCDGTRDELSITLAAVPDAPAVDAAPWQLVDLDGVPYGAFQLGGDVVVLDLGSGTELAKIPGRAPRLFASDQGPGELVLASVLASGRAKVNRTELQPAPSPFLGEAGTTPFAVAATAEGDPMLATVQENAVRLSRHRPSDTSARLPVVYEVSIDAPAGSVAAAPQLVRLGAQGAALALVFEATAADGSHGVEVAIVDTADGSILDRAPALPGRMPVFDGQRLGALVDADGALVPALAAVGCDAE